MGRFVQPFGHDRVLAREDGVFDALAGDSLVARDAGGLFSRHHLDTLGEPLASSNGCGDEDSIGICRRQLQKGEHGFPVQVGGAAHARNGDRVGIELARHVPGQAVQSPPQILEPPSLRELCELYWRYSQVVRVVGGDEVVIVDGVLV